MYSIIINTRPESMNTIIVLDNTGHEINSYNAFYFDTSSAIDMISEKYNFKNIIIHGNKDYCSRLKENIEKTFPNKYTITVL